LVKSIKVEDNFEKKKDGPKKTKQTILYNIDI